MQRRDRVGQASPPDGGASELALRREVDVRAAACVRGEPSLSPRRQPRIATVPAASARAASPAAVRGKQRSGGPGRYAAHNRNGRPAIGELESHRRRPISASAIGRTSLCRVKGSETGSRLSRCRPPAHASPSAQCSNGSSRRGRIVPSSATPACRRGRPSRLSTCCRLARSGGASCSASCRSIA
jgi:hypothetical protein